MPVEEIIASLFEAVVYQNLATLTKGNTPLPEVLLLGGPNLFFTGLQEAWRHHLSKLWAQRKVALPEGRDPASLIVVPDGGALLRVPRLRRDRPRARPPGVGVYSGPSGCAGGSSEGQHEQKAQGGRARPASRRRASSRRSSARVRRRAPGTRPSASAAGGDAGAGRLRLRQHHGQGGRALAGRGSCSSPATRCRRATPSRTPRRCSARCARPGFDATWRARPDRLRQGPAEGRARRRRRGGRDGGPRHRRAALLPRRRRDLRRRRHRRQDHDPAPGHGGRLPAELAVLVGQRRVPPGRGRALRRAARGVRGAGVRRPRRCRASPWAAACSSSPTSSTSSARAGRPRRSWPRSPRCCPVNVWIYAGQLQNLAAAGRKFVLQGGTHRNLAVVKAQVDFIRGKVPDAEVVRAPVLRRGGRDRRGAVRGATGGRRAASASVPRLRHHRGADLHEHHERRHGLPLVPGELHAHVHRRAAARRERAGRGARCRSPRAGSA